MTWVAPSGTTYIFAWEDGSIGGTPLNSTNLLAEQGDAQGFVLAVANSLAAYVDAGGLSTAAAGQIPVATSSGTAFFRDPLEINPTDPPYNAKFDWIGTFAQMTTGSNDLRISGHVVSSADIGKQVIVKGEGTSGASLVAFISAVNTAGLNGHVALVTTHGGSTPANAAGAGGVTSMAFGSDDTTAINAALAASAATSGHSVVRMPEGWARFSQLVIPTGCRVRTAGWGIQWGALAGPAFGGTGGTLLQQLDGQTVDAIIFTDRNTNGTTAYIGPLDIELGVVEGPFVTTGTQNGINVTVTGGTLFGRPQDGFRLHDTQVLGFPGNAFNFPNGLVPLQGFTNNRALFNGGYGLSITDSTGGVIQMGSVTDFSGDCNALGLIYVTGMQHPNNSGLMTFKGIKSEANSFSQNNFFADSHEWTPSIDQGQLNCITLDNCEGHFVIEADHISDVKDLVADPTGATFYAPGPLVTLTGSVTPTIQFNASLRSISGETHATDVFMINDTVNSVTVDKTVKSGFYGAASSYLPIGARVHTATSSATPAINVGTTDEFTITALAVAITSMTTNLTGTPVDGQSLLIRIKDNGTARAITWGSSFVSSGVATLLATTAISKTHTIALKYDAAAAKWVCLAVDATGY